MNNNYLKNITKIDKKTLIYYICFSFIIFYIWYVSSININTLTPIIIISLFIFYKQNIAYNEENEKKLKLNNIEQNITKNYKYIKDEEIIYFLNDIHYYKNINENTFQTMVTYINLFFKTRDVEVLLKILDVFDKLSTSLEVEEMYKHRNEMIKLKTILSKHLRKEKYKKVEFQSFIPYSSTLHTYNPFI